MLRQIRRLDASILTLTAINFVSSLGISMVAASFIGLFIGYTLDGWWGTSPWMTLLWLGFGIAAGFRNIFILTARALREQKNDKGDDGA